MVEAVFKVQLEAMGVSVQGCMCCRVMTGGGEGVFSHCPNSKLIVAGQNEGMQDCSVVSSPPADLWSPSLHCMKVTNIKNPFSHYYVAQFKDRLIRFWIKLDKT